MVPPPAAGAPAVARAANLPIMSVFNPFKSEIMDGYLKVALLFATGPWSGKGENVEISTSCRSDYPHRDFPGLALGLGIQAGQADPAFYEELGDGEALYGMGCCSVLR